MADTGESLALAGISALVGAVVRQPEINRLLAEAQEDAEEIASLRFRLREVVEERDQLARDKIDLIAENARRRELVPPEQEG